MYTATTVQENHFRTIPVTQGINHHITQVIEEDHQNEEIHRILHKIIIIDQIVEITIQDQIQMQHNLFLDSIHNQTQEINTIPIINHEIHHITEIETIHIIELQLNQINCESSDSESDTENTTSINMIAVENDYEPIIYEQPFSSHIYENQLELLHSYYIEPIHSTQTAQETNKINTTNQSNENNKTKCLNTNHIYQNIQKEQPKEKIWTIPFLLESPRNKEFQPPDLEIDFLIDSGAESNIINIPTWNEIKTLHPKLTPLETSSKLATAQGSTLVNYGKIQLFLLPTRTMEQNKILNKPFKQIFHITDIKHNIIGIPFISKYIPTITS